MAEFVVPLRKEIKDSLTKQGMQNVRDLHRKRLAEGEKRNECFFQSESISLGSKKEHAPYFAHHHKSTCHSDYFHHER